jgi:GMP synthase (glutamine-hydrolysing)
MPHDPIGRFRRWLKGTELEIIRPYVGDAVPTKPADGLIVLGGSMSATAGAPTTWLPEVQHLLAAAVADAVPTLGICLGAQLLAVACGAEVEQSAAPGREAGVIDVKWRDAAAADPLVAGLPDPFPAPSWHVDAVARLPAGSVWLGESAMYPYQAFRVGKAAWGLQFHPEVSLAAYRKWAGGSTDTASVAAAESFDRRHREVTDAANALAQRFARLMSSSLTV